MITILAGGKEKPVDTTDLEVRRNYAPIKAAATATTQMTLALEELARNNKSIAFIHKFPGFVNTGVIDRFLVTSASGVWYLPATFARFVILPVVNLLSTTPDVAGERALFLITSSRYPPAEPREGRFGVPLPAGMQVAKSSIIKDGRGNGVYRLGELDDSAIDSGEENLEWRSGDASKIVWESTLATWERALGGSA